MELDAAEDHLLKGMVRPRELSVSHREALKVAVPRSLSEVRAVGLDTNVLKALRRELAFAEELFVTLGLSNVAIIAPSQVITEFWNNHETFSKEEWNGFQSDLSGLKRRLAKGTLPGYNQDLIGEIEALVDKVSDGLEDTKTPAHLQKSVDLIQSLLERATVPQVSRVRFAEIASVRLFNKTPPGFEDEKDKTAAGGDFYAWCDFMLGALCVEPEAERAQYLLITNELKADWKSGGRGHPALVEEFHSLCGGQLSILTLSELRKLLKDNEATLGASTGSAASADDSPSSPAGAEEGVVAE